MIQDHYREAFYILELAGSNGSLALLACKNAVTGEPVIAVCSVRLEKDKYLFTPLAKLFNGDPFEELIPPDVDEEIK